MEPDRVTAQPQGLTCNARYCRGGYWAGDIPHCTTCHRNDHNACVQCGACMPARADWGLYKDRRDIVRVTYGVRADKLYCSNSCRQRAYRRRKAES